MIVNPDIGLVSNLEDVMRILFMGTPEFAVPCLKRLVEDGHDLCGVFTKPDRPRGRGFQISFSPVKEAAATYGIPVYQPRDLKDDSIVSVFRKLNPDIVVVTAYGQILPEKLLNIPPYGCVNVHASLLPAYRGAAPIQWSIINGEKKTGITTMYMAKGMDTGDIIISRETRIDDNETFGKLHDRMKILGAELLSETLNLISSGKAPRIKQNDEAASYAPMIDKTMWEIDFSKPAQSIHNLIRGLSPIPGARTKLNGRQIKIYSAMLLDGFSAMQPGEINVTQDGISVCCGDGRLILVTELQEQCGRRMGALEYLRGHRDVASGRFGG